MIIYNSGGSSLNEIVTYHILVMDNKGKTMRINWMGYSSGTLLKKILIERIGYDPEELYSDGIFGISFYPFKK